MKALVICGESIGDTVFSTPVIRALKVQLEDVEVHGLLAPSTVFLMEENPYLDQSHLFEGSLWKLRDTLRKERFDLIINLRADFRSRILLLWLNRRCRRLPSHRWKEWLMVNLKINHLRNTHQVDRMLHLLEPEHIKPDELGLDYFIPERDTIEPDWLPQGFRREYVVFALSAPYATRRLPVDRMIELCDKINRPVILIGSEKDADTGEVISRFFERGHSVVWEEGLVELNKKTIVYNACGKFNFNQMASLVKQAKAVFAFDSDFIPVASAFKKEIFGLWGSTILLFGRYPYHTRFSVLESNSVSCRPCSSQGFDACPKGHFKCMRDIMFDFYLS